MVRKTALITGSGKNIGRAVALRLAHDRLNLVIHGGSDKEACKKVATEAERLGVRTLVSFGDLGEREQVR